MENKINLLTLKFTDKNLEKEFITHLNKGNLFQVRFGIFLTIGFFIVYGFVDIYTYPQNHTSLWLIRLIILLLLSFSFLYTFHSRYIKQLQLYSPILSFNSLIH